MLWPSQFKAVYKIVFGFLFFGTQIAYYRFLGRDTLKVFYKHHQVKTIFDLSKMEYNMDISKNKIGSHSTNTTPVGHIEDERQLSNTTANFTRPEEDCSEMEAFLQVGIYVSMYISIFIILKK